MVKTLNNLFLQNQKADDLWTWYVVLGMLGLKHAICLKDYRLQSYLSIQYVHRDSCKHLGIDSSTDHPDRYSNLFLYAYINRHVHAKYLKMI